LRQGQERQRKEQVDAFATSVQSLSSGARAPSAAPPPASASLGGATSLSNYGSSSGQQSASQGNIGAHNATVPAHGVSGNGPVLAPLTPQGMTLQQSQLAGNVVGKNQNYWSSNPSSRNDRSSSSASAVQGHVSGQHRSASVSGSMHPHQVGMAAVNINNSGGSGGGALANVGPSNSSATTSAQMKTSNLQQQPPTQIGQYLHFNQQLPHQHQNFVGSNPSSSSGGNPPGS